MGQIFLKSPSPIWPDEMTLDDRLSPLKPDGSDFPCKNIHHNFKHNHYGETVWQAGSTVSVVLGGSGVLSAEGGSCQFSLSHDLHHDFRVLKSIVGGCPTSAYGTLGEGYPLYIPAEIPSGKAVFAWTWFNSIGEPTMHMNCAPITIHNPEQKKWLNYVINLPQIFMANIGNCKLKEGSDVIFPESDISPLARSPEQPPEACFSHTSHLSSATGINTVQEQISRTVGISFIGGSTQTPVKSLLSSRCSDKATTSKKTTSTPCSLQEFDSSSFMTVISTKGTSSRFFQSSSTKTETLKSNTVKSTPVSTRAIVSTLMSMISVSSSSTTSNTQNCEFSEPLLVSNFATGTTELIKTVSTGVLSQTSGTVKDNSEGRITATLSETCACT
ncbi:hypothetical protein TWF102_008070 [Orbilia oligospora]|uniref:Lytic polysaccharide monooxygenase n=1 Tax=Orbilia oligospora TaxID=2813651 RepID=A0A7C8NJ09_ORBOL|nr:hypothetical protein TWF706_009807 [Orbilia oligospora]KAF3091855.1 hypothetical protein TWF103_011417 [Orbilia oligospora]KAF3110493.1 hypothetical protein TWF102_008070 [Orbilia oligospora]